MSKSESQLIEKTVRKFDRISDEGSAIIYKPILKSLLAFLGSYAD